MYCDSYFIDFVYASLILALVSLMLTRHATRLCVSISYTLYDLLFNDLILIYTSYLLFHIHFNMHTTIQWHKERSQPGRTLSFLRSTPQGSFIFWGLSPPAGRFHLDSTDLIYLSAPISTKPYTLLSSIKIYEIGIVKQQNIWKWDRWATDHINLWNIRYSSVGTVVLDPTLDYSSSSCS